MALALDAAGGVHVPRVDIESLLWDLRDVLRGLSQVNRAQAAEIERLGGTRPNDIVSAEYEERAHAATAAVDAALDQFDSESVDAGRSTQYEPFNVAAWVQATRHSLVAGAAAEADAEAEAEVGVEASAAEADNEMPSRDEPSDFWDTQGFKWEDEPEAKEGDEHFDFSSASDEEDSSAPQPSSDGDSATLFHPEDDHLHLHDTVIAKHDAIITSESKHDAVMAPIAKKKPQAFSVSKTKARPVVHTLLLHQGMLAVL